MAGDICVMLVHTVISGLGAFVCLDCDHGFYCPGENDRIPCPIIWTQADLVGFEQCLTSGISHLIHDHLLAKIKATHWGFSTKFHSSCLFPMLALRFLNGGVLRNLNIYYFQELYPVCSAPRCPLNI